MNKARFFLVNLFIIIYFFSCGNANKTRVVIYTRVPIGATLYLNLVPYFKEKKVTVDSAIVKSNKDSIVLFVPHGEERLYELVLKDRGLTATFINDSKSINIHLDFFKHSYEVSGSQATTILRNFNKNQLTFNNGLKLIAQQMDSLKARHITGPVADSVRSSFYTKLNEYFQRNVKFEDTVKSPAAFISIYSLIEFDTDFKAFKKFITANCARFPDSKPIQEIKKRALATIRIYELEFNVGDKIPFITLPDINGQPFSTSSLKGSYYLIDFWSTECDQCMPFKIEQHNIDSLKNTKVKFVSVAIDDQKEVWKSLINRNKLNWTELIDEQMWEGPAVNTLVFDSIPFNFLVSPQGVILRKAIPADSLVKVLSRLKIK